MKAQQLTSWIGSVGVAALFGFTGIFKLTGNPDAQATFEQIGGPAMMVFTGVVELVIAVLILLPKTRAIGSISAMGVMAGAIASHLTGMVPNDDMLPLAVILFAASAVVAFLHRAELPMVGKLACCSMKHAEI
ncbi:MAG: DoxX family protein [Phycisphaeraceae bacterium]